MRKSEKFNNITDTHRDTWSDRKSRPQVPQAWQLIIKKKYFPNSSSNMIFDNMHFIE